ncbi:MAG: ribonuclease HII [Bdellovibrionales bacterium]|nr:ribonuclease HII [Bdellovibrionales bacterium]
MQRPAPSKKKSFEPYDWQEKSQDFVVVGVDEVGRGCLAGPVYASAVIIDEKKSFKEYTDSKALSARRREDLAEQIQRDHRVGIGFATVEEITAINILQASLLAMSRAIAELKLSSSEWERTLVLVDGHQKIPQVSLEKQIPLIKGDLRAEPVAAASIVAKVTRDRLLTEMSQNYPEYGFEKHKGYCTAAHKEAIAKHGPTPVHRPTFAGVREFLSTF